MRYILLIISIFTFFSHASAQADNDDLAVNTRVWRVPQLPWENHEIAYKGSVDLQGSTQESLYTRAYYWLKQNLKSDDLEMRVNKQLGKIAGIGKVTYNQSVLMNNAAQGIYFDYDIQVMGNGYNYNISNLRATIPSGSIDYSAMYQEELNKGDAPGQWTHKYRYEMLSDMHSFITLFIQGLQRGMVTK